MKNTKILIIDDDEDDFFILRNYIKTIKEQEFEIHWCSSFKEAVSTICAGEYQLYFVDYLLGAHTGLDFIKEAIRQGCEEPVILLTGNGNRGIDVQAMQHGAVDYLIKAELNLEKIERCIRYSLDRAASLKALKSNERKFRNIFERSRDTVFIAGDNLVFTEINEAAAALFEYKVSELKSKSLYGFLPIKSDVEDIKLQLSEHGIVADKEIDIVTKNGETKNCIITISQELDTAGNAYFQGIIHEITALKKAEKANLTLGKLEMAGRLVRTVAHEVRNPLSNILISLEELKLSTTNEADKPFLDMIERNGKRINKLIGELLNSARPMEISLGSVSLQRIIEDSIEAAHDRISLQNIQLFRDFEASGAWVMADYESLKIAFINIIINAVEAMQKNSGELHISVKEKDADGYTVVIRDNGFGISKENLNRLFEPYFTTKQNGMGLGLASTLNILQSHNAKVEVESVQDQGTVFILHFDKAPESAAI
ncbi:MAG: response regulator [Chitinophagaceae bacterium]|nr:MAG: response regulator [Chitinophagaceae bacterium]